MKETAYEKISYLCSKCQHKNNVWMDSPCVECHRGSKFLERPSVSRMNLPEIFDTLSRTQREAMYELIGKIREINQKPLPEIQDVIFSNPATIVFWSDKTKTVVKCGADDLFDPEKGLAMAIAKKALGNKGSYFDEIKPRVKKYYDDMLAKIEAEQLFNELHAADCEEAADS